MKKKLIISGGILGTVLLMGAAILGYQDFQIITAPGNPSSGYLRTWADNSAGYFKCLTSGGSACYWAASPTSASAVQGNGSKFQLSTGTTTTNDCVKFDANGNTVDFGSGCGGSITFQTNGVNNSSQSTLNLINGTNCTVTNTTGGTVSIACSAGGGGAPSVQTDVTASRAITTVYQNTNSGPLYVSAAISSTSNSLTQLLSDASNPPTTVVAANAITSGNGQQLFGIVLPNNYYEVTNGAGTGSVYKWVEWH